jgi:uncharacterized protein involved in type VI secretion and phage assembly
MALPPNYAPIWPSLPSKPAIGALPVSTVRQLAEGTVITLTQHDAHLGDDARFKVLSVDHHGANNLGTQAAELLGNTG